MQAPEIASVPDASPRVSVIVPTLNEADNIDPLLRGIFEAAGPSTPVEVIVVDDGSMDGTPERVLGWEASHPVRLISRRGRPEELRGLAGAVIAGAQAARSQVVVVMDADLSHPPRHIPDLVQPIVSGTHDMVVGSRYVPGGSTPGWPPARRLMSRLAALMAWPLVDVRDPMSGFFAIRRDRLLELGSAAEGFKIGLEVMVRGGERLRFTEVPIEFQDRTRGESKLGPLQVLAYLRQLLVLAGGAVCGGSAMRFGLVGLIGMAVDLLAFQALLAFGVVVGSAHLVSFFLATANNYLLNARWSFSVRQGPRQIGYRPYMRFLAVSLMALFLRGAVLAFLMQIAHLPAQAAIVGAIIGTAAINYLGSAFFVFPTTDPAAASVRWRVAAVGVVGYLVALRLFYLGLPELLAEEAYYWNYAQHPDLSYLDHPPMVAWLVTLGTRLFGDTEFGVRIGALACWLVTAFFGYRLTRDLFDKNAAMRAVLLLAALPFFMLVGFYMTPDAPLTACWAGTIYFLERALLRERRVAWWGVGVCMGLGLLSKYTIALLGPAALIFMILDRRSRRWFARPEPYVAALVALLMFCPVIIWNAHHQWASFAFQTVRRTQSAAEFSLHLLIGWALLLLTPVGLFALLKVMFRPDRAKPGTVADDDAAARRRRFCMVLAVFPLSVFIIFSLRHAPKLNWVGPLWLAVLPLLADDLVAKVGVHVSRLAQFGRQAWPATIAVTMLLYGVFLHYLVLGFPLVDYRMGKQLVGWRELARQVEKIEDDLERQGSSEPLVVGTGKYFIASELAFYREQIEQDSGDRLRNEGIVGTTGRHLFGGSSVMYEYWFPPASGQGRTILVVSAETKSIEDARLGKFFDHMDPIQTLKISKNGKFVTRYFYRVGYGYHG